MNPANSEPREWRTWAAFYEEGLDLQNRLERNGTSFDAFSYANKKFVDQEDRLVIDLKV